jgi:oligopeptide transport system substrate-binding protein
VRLRRAGGRPGRATFVCAMLVALAACSNNPYSESDDDLKVRYKTLPGPTKTLDPAVSYSSLEHQVTANVYETLLEYHYLKRPYTLMPGLSVAVPERQDLEGGRVAYRFDLREGMQFQNDPSFALGGEGRTTRTIVAADIAFELMRIADPAVTSPVIATFSKIEGLREFSERLQALRDETPEFAELRIDRQYEEAGGIPGVRLHGDYGLEIVLTEPYPQILYWFAMPFTTPVPWEAVAYYDGEDGRPFFKDHPVGCGPFVVSEFDKQSKIVMSRNENWYGVRHPEWKAPGTVYPSEGEAIDGELGRLDPAYVGRSLPLLDRVELRLEKENIPAFNKFLQGYYDASGIVRESFDKVVYEGALSPEMAARGMKLEKQVNPDLRYIGFNMNDPVIGTPAGDRGRKLRQAMSLAIDVVEYNRVFSNGRGVPAQSPIPPGIYGYAAEYRNPYRQPDLARAQALLEEAGYPSGIDSDTGKPLRLSFDLGDTSTAGRLRFRFFVDQWAKLGIDVEVAATTYNKFRQKVAEGAYQIFMWGWIADYPDPENFLFLLWGTMAQSTSGGPNTANFDHPEFNRLFEEMKGLENGPERLAIIWRMRDLLEVERPWIELSHGESYALYHAWMKNVKPAGLSLPAAKYVDIDPVARARMREEWNRPILWPAYAVALLATMIAVPGVLTFLRERQ